MPGRTVTKWMRAYVDGYDLSGYARSIGSCGVAMKEADLTCIPDAVQGFLPNAADQSIGALSTVLDPVATVGAHAILSATPTAPRTVTYVFGDRAAPALGNPVFAGQFEQLKYDSVEEGGAIIANVDLTESARRTTGVGNLYFNPFGVLLHPMGAETAVNSAIGADDTGTAGFTADFGGYMVYHITTYSTAGSVTLKVQDAATNVDGSFADLTGATTGALSTATFPTHGVIYIPKTGTVRRYLRWQLVFATTTSVTFALSFVRARI